MVLLLRTVERSGIDRYDQELARRIATPTVETKRYLSIREACSLLAELRSRDRIIHFPSQHFARYALFLGKPFIVTVHDVVRMCFPLNKESLGERLGLRLDALGLKKARHIIAVSEHTRQDMIEYLGIKEDKISVIYNGIDHNIFKPVSTGRRPPFPYLLYVGSERPRKNFNGLLAAFAILKAEDGVYPDLKLVKVGISGRSDIFRQVTLREAARLGLQDAVVFTEYISDDKLAAYYSSALALVIPSFYEGFGLPLVEAMACGCPVIAANCSSLPEVASGAALLVEADDNDGIAQAIRLMITDWALRRRFIEKGLKRAADFSWDTTARQTLDVYHRV